MKVLLAEDDENLGLLLSRLLKRKGVEVLWVKDGQEAYDIIYKDSYDVLILDWMMPKLSGIELLKLLRQEDYQGNILMLTAKDTVEDRVTGLNNGADDYLVKPFEMVELLARLNALCRRQGVYNSGSLSHRGYTLEESSYTLN